MTRPNLTVVPSVSPRHDDPSVRAVDWSILMARAQDGNGAAYARLLTEITPYLRALASRRQRQASDIEDAVQDILLTVHAIRATYDPARPFGPWLVAIANRRLVDRIRLQSRHRMMETPLMPEHETPFNSVAARDETADHARLVAAIEALPEGQKQAIRMLKLNELSLNEASSASGLSIASLKVSTHRAIARLRDVFTCGARK